MLSIFNHTLSISAMAPLLASWLDHPFNGWFSAWTRRRQGFLGIPQSPSLIWRFPGWLGHQPSTPAGCVDLPDFNQFFHVSPAFLAQVERFIHNASPVEHLPVPTSPLLAVNCSDGDVNDDYRGPIHGWIQKTMWSKHNFVGVLSLFNGH